MLVRVREQLNRAGFKRYFFNTSWMMAEQMLRIVVGLLVGIWVARYLGPDQFGLFSYVVAFTAIFGGIAKLGLDGILVRELLNQPELRDTCLGTAFWLKIIGAFLAIALMALIVPFTSNDATTNLFIFIVAAGLIFQSVEVVEFYFQSQVLAKIVSICKVTQLTLSSIIKVYLVLTQSELIWFVCVTAFDALSLSVSYFVAYKIRGNTSFFKCFDGGIAKSLVKDSWPLMFSMLMVVMYMKVDQVMIKEILGSESAGLYSSAVRLVDVSFVFANIISVSLFPAILKSKKISIDLYDLRLKRLFSFLIYSSVPMVIIVFLFSGDIVFILYGDAYYGSVEILKVLFFSVPLAYWSIASSRWYVAEGLQLLLMFRALAAMLINIFLNLIFINIVGVVGAALATVATYFFVGIVFDLFSKKTRLLYLSKASSLMAWRLI